MFHHQTLPNGLTLIGETLPSSKSVAVGFFVRTGSRDEAPEESGVSHYLEHMLFKGTPRRSAADVNRDFDRIGANYNAYTSEENTVFYAAVLPEYLPDVIDILADILRPSLRVEDFDMEKNVILEEIGMYEDQPTWSAYDHARKLHFGSHPLGNTVLGSVESIKALTRDQMYMYFDRRYVANNVTAVAAGNYDWAKFAGWIAEACGGWKSGDAPRGPLVEALETRGPKGVAKAGTTMQHMILIAPGPTADAPSRYAADVLAVALGDDSGSRLYWELVDPGRVDSASVSFHEYQGAGTYYTSFSCEPDLALENLDITKRVLAEVQKSGITAEELNQAKSKVLSRVVRSGERPMGRMQAVGMAWTNLRQHRGVDDELKAFESVTQDDIRAVLDRYPIDRATVLGLGPKVLL